MKRNIIINADDFGYDMDTVAATIECFERGALTSATIMPKMPATDAAVRFAREHPEFSFGVHLTFVCDTVESPVCDARKVPALVRSDGRFLPSNQVRLLALRGALPVAQIAEETAAQIAFLIGQGVNISHVDSHGHLHKFKPFVQALKEVLPKFGIRRVRNVQSEYIEKPFRSPTYWLGGFWRRRVMKHFLTTPHFFMCTGASDRQRAGEILDRKREGVLEIGFHPGSPRHADGWRNEERLACLKLGLAAQHREIALIGWKDV